MIIRALILTTDRRRSALGQGREREKGEE